MQVFSLQMLTVYVLRKFNHLLTISLEFKWTNWKLSSILNYDWKNNESPEQESVKIILNTNH